ncbi:MAG: AAA family ATPase [Chloroflexota bacterium]|nr:AAA family ATPase [Chloroflexota bacterium]
MPEERKLVTILFADVTGSTSLGESLDPEDVRALMGCYYTHAREVVAHHGGTIEKFIGDAVMAVFGLTQAHGDDAERALAAAMALRDAVAADEFLGPSFQLRIGVNTGEVVATSDQSSGDFLITGDAVNVAARLQQHTSPGEITAGERTANAAQTAFVFDEPRLVEVKGKRLPLRAFPLKGVQAVRQVFRPPFVGRKSDLMQLELLKERVLEEEIPQLVSIVAPAGTGKTRLLEEFLRRLDPDEGFEVAMVRCLPYGQTLTYWPLRGLLDALLEGEEITRTRVSSIFTAVGYKTEDAARLADLVLTTLGIESDAASVGDRESIFSAWRLLIEAFAQQSPRVLVFEDLHWASDSMLYLVEHVISLHTHARLLLIVLSRPELLDRRPSWGGGRQNFTALSLQPFSAKLTQDLITQLSAHLSAEVRKRLVERSGGNPFFALELVRGLSERGIAGENVTLDVLPDTVHAAVLGRMDLLTKQERTALQVAAVASRAIRSQMLHAVLADLSDQEIDAAVDGLVGRDMLVPSEGNMFAFRHILIRDVAYGTLSRAERVRLHAKIAAWLETTAGEQVDQYTEVIAYHYREAVLLARQAAVPRPMSVETTKAAQYLERSGELASHAGAFVEAETYLKDAINLAPQSEHLRLYEKLGDCLVWGDTVVKGYSSALECWPAEGEQDPLTGARLLRKLLSAYSKASEQPERAELEALWSQARLLVEQAGDEAELWRFRVSALRWLLQQALVRGRIGEVEAQDALTTCQTAAAFFEQQEDWRFLDKTLDMWATFMGTIGAHTDALAVCRRRLAAPGIMTYERGDATGTIASTYFLLGDYTQCITTARDALAALHPDEPIEYYAGVVSIALWATYVSGRWDEFPPLLITLGQIWERLQLRLGAGRAVFDGYLASFMLAKAREDRPAMDIAASTIERMFPGSADIKDFIAFLREDDFSKLNVEETGAGVTGLLISFFSEFGSLAPQKFMQGHVFQNDMTIRCVRIAQALSDNDNIQLAKAIDDAEAHHLLVHAARMRVVLAQRTADHAQLARARSVLERLEDRHYLRKLEEVEAVLFTR